MASRAWIKRFSLHLAAAVGATGIFVAAAAVGASQTRQQPPPAVATPARPTAGAGRPQAVVPSRSPTPAKVIPERSISGTVRNVDGDGLQVTTANGRDFRILPAPGALIRLNGKTVKLDQLAPGDTVVILGQQQPGPGARFLAHAITARRK